MIKYRFINTIIIILLCYSSNYAQVKGSMFLSFENEKKIIEWGEKEFGYQTNPIILTVEGKKLLVLFGDYYSGVIKQSIFIFLQSDKKNWSFRCMAHTFTREVSIDVNNENREVIFKAKNGKVIMKLPFDALESDIDSNEK